MTVPDLVELHTDFMRRRALAAGSIEKRLGVLRLTTEACGPLLGVTTAQIEAMLDARQGRGGGPLDARTRHTWLSHLHCFYSWAIQNDHATHNPTLRLIRPKMRRRLPRPIGEADSRRALSQAPNPTMQAWLLLGGHAGLRCAEMAGLRGEDVADGSMRVLGKGNKERVVPMHPKIAELALSWPTHGPLFVGVTGEAYQPHDVSHFVGRYLRRIGVAATAHQLRHRSPRSS
jgi:integrase/recombinase XerD